MDMFKFYFVIIALVTLFLLFAGCAQKGITKQEVDKILINKIVDDLIFSARQSLKWKNDLLLADKVLTQCKSKNIKSIVFFTGKNKVWVSNDLSEFGKTIQIDFNQYEDDGKYLIKHSKNELFVIKSFIHDDTKNNKKIKYYVLIVFLIENKDFIY